MENAARLRRWRLILGQEGQERIASMGGCALTEEELKTVAHLVDLLRRRGDQ